MRHYSVGGYARISKAAARRAFNAGETVYRVGRVAAGGAAAVVIRNAERAWPA